MATPPNADPTHFSPAPKPTPTQAPPLPFSHAPFSLPIHSNGPHFTPFIPNLPPHPMQAPPTLAPPTNDHTQSPAPTLTPRPFR